MFRNNNSAVVKHLSKRSLRADIRRNIFIILTIAISVCLMATLSLIETGVRQERVNRVEGMYQAALLNVPQETVQALKNDPALDGAGEYFSISENKTENGTINSIYMDEEMLRLGKFECEGALPSKTNDVILEKAYLERIGANPKIGDSITLDLGDRDKNYHITGFLHLNNEAKTHFSVIRSKNSFATEDASRFVYIRLSNSESMSAEELDDEIFNVANTYGISRKNISTSSLYFNAIEPVRIDALLSMIGIAALIGLASALVIYSIFYISVTAKVREYGQLRTIGTTKKQIKKIVFKEGVCLSAIGIPIGLISACILTFIIIPKGWNTLNTLKICLAVAAFTFIIVSLAIRRPMKIASTTPAVEAMRYSAATDTMKLVKTEKLHRKLTPFNLAVINFSRNRKKSVLTLLSLGLSGILFICAASYSASVSIESISRGELFTYGDYQLCLTLGNNDNSDGYAMSRIQQNNPLDEDMEERILAIDGVTGIETEKAAKLNYTLYEGTREQSYVSGFNENEISEINSKLTSGTCDYRQCMKQNGIIVMISDVVKELHGSVPALGDKITFEFYTADGVVEKEYTVKGVMKAGIKDGTFLMPEEALKNVMGVNTNIKISVETDSEKKNNVERELRAITKSNSLLELKSLDDIIETKKGEFQTMSFVLYTIVLVIALFGIISLINTVVTNVLSRRQELGVLQAIGLSNKQLNQLLQSEGIIYTLSTIVATLTLGTGLGWMLCESIRRFSEVPYIDYHFPLNQTLMFIGVFLVIQIFISYVSGSSINKKSLVERMRDS